MKTVDREKLWEEYQKKKDTGVERKTNNRIFTACQACCRKIEHVSRI